MNQKKEGRQHERHRAKTVSRVSFGHCTDSSEWLCSPLRFYAGLLATLFHTVHRARQYLRGTKSEFGKRVFGHGRRAGRCCRRRTVAPAPRSGDHHREFFRLDRWIRREENWDATVIRMPNSSFQPTAAGRYGFRSLPFHTFSASGTSVLSGGG